MLMIPITFSPMWWIFCLFYKYFFCCFFLSLCHNYMNLKVLIYCQQRLGVLMVNLININFSQKLDNIFHRLCNPNSYSNELIRYFFYPARLKKQTKIQHKPFLITSYLGMPHLSEIDSDSILLKWGRTSPIINVTRKISYVNLQLKMIFHNKVKKCVLEYEPTVDYFYTWPNISVLIFSMFLSLTRFCKTNN